MNHFKKFCQDIGQGTGPSGAIQRAFRALDEQKKGHLNLADFIASCERLNWDPAWGDPEEIHAGLDFSGLGYVTVDELVFLEDNYLVRRIMEKSPEALYAARQREMRKQNR